MGRWDTVHADGRREGRVERPINEAERIRRQGGSEAAIVAAMMRGDLERHRAALLKQVAEVEAAIARLDEKEAA